MTSLIGAPGQSTCSKMAGHNTDFFNSLWRAVSLKSDGPGRLLQLLQTKYAASFDFDQENNAPSRLTSFSKREKIFYDCANIIHTFRGFCLFVWQYIEKMLLSIEWFPPLSEASVCPELYNYVIIFFFQLSYPQFAERLGMYVTLGVPCYSKDEVTNAITHNNKPQDRDIVVLLQSSYLSCLPFGLIYIFFFAFF